MSKNDSFLAFANACAQLVADKNPADVAALSALPLSQDGFGPTVEDVRKGLIGKIGENMSIRRFKRYAGGGKLASYLHGTRIGVIVEFDGDDVGRQGRRDARRGHEAGGAVVRPTCRPTLVEKERKIATEKAAESGKPADIVAKMVEGSVQKYLKEVSLLQPGLREERQADGRADAQGRHDHGEGLHAVRGRRRHREEESTTSLPKWRPRSPRPRASNGTGAASAR